MKSILEQFQDKSNGTFACGIFFENFDTLIRELVVSGGI